MDNKTNIFGIEIIADEDKLDAALREAYGDDYGKWPEGSHWFMVDGKDKRFFTLVDTRPLGVDIFTKDTLFYRLRPDEIRAAGIELDYGYMEKLKALAEAAVAVPEETVINGVGAD